MGRRRARKRRRPGPPASPPQQLPQQAIAPAAASDPSRVWLPELVQRYAASLMPNEVACALRLVNKATAAQFSAPQHTIVRLSQPVPHHAFAWRWGGPDAMRALARHQRLDLARLTARSGSIANLEVLLGRGDGPCPLDADTFEAAAAAGQLDVCAWLKERGCPWLELNALTAAAAAGHQATCEWLLADCCTEAVRWGAAAAAARMEALRWGAAAAAARGGHVGLMDWLLLPDGGRSRHDVPQLLAGAAGGCDLHTLQRLHHTYLGSRGWELYDDEKLPAVISAAAGSPTADWQAKVEWLQARGYPQGLWAFKEAAAKPDALSRLQWLRQRGYRISSIAARSAAKAGNVEVLQYVLGQGIVADAEMMAGAAQGGHVAVMEVLHARGVRSDESTMWSAARRGHLPAMAWLVERLGARTALTARVFALAACSGRMELLTWLRDRGCLVNEATFARAAAYGSEEQLEWLAEQGCPMGDGGEPYAAAAAAGELSMLRCLRRLGCAWSPDGGTFTRVVARVRDLGQHVERALCWLLDNGCPVDWAKAEAAAMFDVCNDLLVGWLRAQREQRGWTCGVPLRAGSGHSGAAASAASSDPSRIWLPEFVERFAVSLTSNEVACALRLVNKAAAAQFNTPQHTTIRLSQPVPHYWFERRWASPGAVRNLARRQRLELQRLTARSGSIANLELLLARDDLTPVLDTGVFETAAAAGQLTVCAWLRERGCACEEVEALVAAAGGGQQAVCEWLLANGCPRVDNYWGATAAAARGGHVGLVDWLLLRADSTRDVAAAVLPRAAAEGCNLDTLQRLHHTHVDTRPGELPSWLKPDLISAAAGSPTVDWQAKVEWLETRGYPKTAEACRKAATESDALPRLQWLRQRSYPINMHAAANAAEAGDMEALQYVLGQGAEKDPLGIDVMQYAAKGGHVAVMEMLDTMHERGAPMGKETVRTAAAAGHLPAVAWLVETLGADRALTTGVFAAAAQAGSMELLRWLRARGCPWDATVFAAGAEGGSEEQLKWLVDRGCLMGDDGEPYVRATRHGDLAILRCLRRLGCPWGADGSSITRAVMLLIKDPYGSGGHVQRVLGWLLLDQSCPVDWDVAEAVAEQKGDAALTGWLQAQRNRWARAGSGGLP
ncbi:Ankyrin repeat domain-containing protein [Tetrabaena socialis]|uniref:Ankyrin repeat domain-containing protein n=1 Tax=Tetrabaena socialis TaxID=47790 RepID=A0A2J8A2A7_9CHLO|nr:Ankyrin repeat domain-containing protein [Tetrabaena socialis]|eukprot:PNH06642.1 Ankyrin repeat domain-containing protein [Tetrabaena socialis]